MSDESSDIGFENLIVLFLFSPSGTLLSLLSLGMVLLVLMLLLLLLGTLISSMEVIFLIHFSMYALRSDSFGRSKLYLTSKRDGRLSIASSIFSGWFVVAIVRIPSFWFFFFYSKEKKKEKKLWMEVTMRVWVEEGAVMMIRTSPSSSFRKKERTSDETRESRSSMTRIHGAFARAWLNIA